jgi:hypothetical protein
MAAAQSSKSQISLTLSSAITGSAIFVSAMQGVFFLFGEPWTAYTVVAILLAVANIFLAIRYLKTKGNRLFIPVLILYCGQFVIMGSNLAIAEPPYSLRLLQVAIVVTHLATVMAALLAGARIAAPTNAILLSFSVAAGIFISETALGLLPVQADMAASGPEWSGSMDSHPEIGMVYRPYSVMKTYYPDNPRGYFKKEDNRQFKWRLKATGGNVADMVFSRDDPERVRIDITKVETMIEYDIQLNQPHLKVKSDHHYVVRFMARADRPRSIILGFAKAHDSWSGLGLYERIELTSEWQSFQEDFIAIADDDNARIHFDVGGSDIPVEVTAVSLRSLPDDQAIEPDIISKRYFVDYKFNARGCRDRDYAIPRPEDTIRILALGDSFTMGVGVHEEDTFASHLERLLNEKSGSPDSTKSYEVINCGVSGYGTEEERRYYELLASKYEPDIVLLTMVWNDDLSFLEEVEKGYLNRIPGKFEMLFFIWGKIQEYRHQRLTFDYTKCVEEILRLDGEVRKQGKRLAVIIFRNGYGDNWDQLASTVTNGLQGTDVPVLDLGKALFEKHAEEDLIVHRIDGHPNEIAHLIAAQEILELLWREKMLPPSVKDSFVPGSEQ